jgi:hypothetical protein
MTASRLGEPPDMRSHRRFLNASRSIGALILFGMIACALSGCYEGDYGGYYGGGYPDYGYAPYSYGWYGGGYRRDFDVHHAWEGHHDDGHHTEFFHGGGAVGHVGGGFHGGGGGFHGGGGFGGGGHGGGGGHR